MIVLYIQNSWDTKRGWNVKYIADVALNSLIYKLEPIKTNHPQAPNPDLNPP